MISGELYQYIYLLIVAILSMSCFNKYGTRQGESIVNSSSSFAGREKLVLAFVILFIGLRPVDIAFVDMVGYDEYYRFHLNETFSFNWKAENLIWDNMLLWFASTGLSSSYFFFLIATFYFGLMFFTCKRYFPNDGYAAFLVFLAAFSTFSYSTNGIKAGLAGVLFCLSLSYRRQLKICLPLVLFTYAFHHSMVIPITAFIATLINNKPKYYLYFWFFSLLMAVGHVSFFQQLFAGFTDERGAEYLLGDMNTYIGFRPDFVLYSAMPILMGWYATKKMGCNSLMYVTLLNIYTLANSVWMLCMYANFTNRIAYLSWFLYPIVLIYPILNDSWNANRYELFSKIGKYHLAFTMFMYFIFYVLFK